MRPFVTVIIALTAVLFIAVSAIMNALFLSSLGRTPVEVGLLATISIGADAVKAIMPVVIVWASVARAWLHVTLGSLILTVVVALSLASGTGFATVTRGAATAAREASVDELAARRRDATEIEARLAGLSQTAPVGVIEAELAASQSNWQWSATKSCTTVNTTAAYKFCAVVFKLRSDLASAQERDRVTAERRDTRARIEVLQASGANTDADPQASALAAVFGVDKSTPRLVLTTSLAVMLELGSVILVLLLTGPALLGRSTLQPSAPNMPAVPDIPPRPIASAAVPTVKVAPKSVPNPVQILPSADRSRWQRQRNTSIVIANRGEGHVE